MFARESLSYGKLRILKTNSILPPRHVKIQVSAISLLNTIGQIIFKPAT